MARFKLFPRNRRPSLGELLGISQASRQVSRKYHVRIVLDPRSPLKNAERRAKRRAGYYSGPMQSRGSCAASSAKVTPAELQRLPPKESSE